MIVDSSAILAILYHEPEAERIACAIAGDPIRLMSSANWLAASMVTSVRVGQEGMRDFDLLISKS